MKLFGVNFNLLIFAFFAIPAVSSAEIISLSCKGLTREPSTVRIDLDNKRASLGKNDFVPIMYLSESNIVWSHNISMNPDNPVFVSVHLNRRTGLLEYAVVGWWYDGRDVGEIRDDQGHSTFGKCSKDEPVL